MALSEPQANMVWEEWLAAEVRANYFADLCATFHRRQNVAIWATLVLSSGAALTLISNIDWLPAAIVPVLAFMAAGVSLYSLVAQNPKSASDCADLHSRWNKLAMEYRDLWQNWYAEDATAKLARMNERAAEISKSGTAYRYEPKRMAKWEDLVVQHHTHHQVRLSA